jgi:hypothetical protein
MIIMSLRGAFIVTKQSPDVRGDCFAAARDNLGELRSASGKMLTMADNQPKIKKVIISFFPKWQL